MHAASGGTKRELVLLECAEPARTSGECAAGVAMCLGLQRPGEPGHAASQRRPTAA